MVSLFKVFKYENVVFHFRLLLVTFDVVEVDVLGDGQVVDDVINVANVRFWIWVMLQNLGTTTVLGEML